MNYSFYLFVNLRIAIIGEGVEYDIQFGIDKSLFLTYESSKYNISDKPEYECMTDFLIAHKNGETYDIEDSLDSILHKEDLVVLLENTYIEGIDIIAKRGDVLRFIGPKDNNLNIGEFNHCPTNTNVSIPANRTLLLNK